MKLQLQSKECPLQLRVPLLRWCVLIVTKVYPSVHHIFWECASFRHLRDGSGQVPPSPVAARIGWDLFLTLTEGQCLLQQMGRIRSTSTQWWTRLALTGFWCFFRASTPMLGWRSQNSIDSWALQGQVLYMFDVDNRRKFK